MALAGDLASVRMPDFQAQLGSCVFALHRLNTEMHGFIGVRWGGKHKRLFQQYAARYQIFNESTQHTAEQKPMSNCSAKVRLSGKLRVGMDWIVITTQARKPIEIGLVEGALERSLRKYHRSQSPDGLSSRCFCIFPAAVRGKSSTGMNRLGTLYAARCSRQYAFNSLSPASCSPGRHSR